jgi:paraquat-inducible protein A
MPPPLIACHECDLLQRRSPIPSGGIARCRRCGAVLYRRVPNGVDRTVALALAGLVLFTVANAFPLLSVRIGEDLVSAELATAVHALWLQGEHALAALVAATCIATPLLVLVLMLHVFLPLRFGRLARGTIPTVRLLHAIREWNMMEVFLLGVLVTIVKLVKMATVIPGPGMIAFFLLIFVLAAASSAMDTDAVWARVARRS